MEFKRENEEKFHPIKPKTYVLVWVGLLILILFIGLTFFDVAFR